MRQFNSKSYIRNPKSEIGRAFTLIELLVVISIITLVIVASLPVLSKMQEGTQLSAAVTTVTVAVEATRKLAMAREGDIEPPVGAKYSGAALVFSPSGEMRLTKNDQQAENSSGYLEPTLNGYADVAGLDFIELPKRARIQGIIRAGPGSGTTLFIDPPFAIRFDEEGRHIVASAQGTSPSSLDRMVIYDGDHNGVYDDSDRRGSYTIDSYNKAAAWDSTELKHELPFEGLESVVGVRIFDIRDPNTFQDLFFSRYTGTPIKP